MPKKFFKSVYKYRRYEVTNIKKNTFELRTLFLKSVKKVELFGALCLRNPKIKTFVYGWGVGITKDKCNFNF